MSDECLFCKIATGEMNTEFVKTTDSMVVFKDINPHAPVHLLLVPRKHIRSVNDLTDDDKGLVAELIYEARELAKEFNVHESGYKLLFNVEYGGGQRIFHLHLHLMGGKKWG